MSAFALLMLSILTAAVLLLSGYFYGRIYQKYIPLLEGKDCTGIGVFTIFALFQILTFLMIPLQLNTFIALIALFLFILAGPVLALILRVDIKPQKYHLLAVCTGLLCTTVITIASARLNMNSTYFDTITYLSEVVESSKASRFGGMTYTSGEVLIGIDTVHDFTGYYYLWGMILRAVSTVFHPTGSLTPVYIWGATFLYSMCLGELIYNSVGTFFKKDQIKGLIFSLLILMPYFTNYYNTTLAFFGNTFRTLAVGWAILLAYYIILKKDASLFLPLTATYFANICMTSSGFFLNAFITAGLLFILAFRKAKTQKIWSGFVLSCIPTFHYALILLSIDFARNYILTIGAVATITLVLLLIVWLLRNHLLGFDRFITILLPIVFIGLCGISFLVRNGDYGYDFFFEQRSKNDMTINITSHESTRELIRNIMFYAMAACAVINRSKAKSFRRFLGILVLLFANPLVQPAVSTYMTSLAYVRTFDLFLNPFVLTYLVFSLYTVITSKVLQTELLAIASFVSLLLGLMNVMNYYSKSLQFQEVGYDWRLKTSPDTYDLYTYVQNNIADPDNKPSVLSQNVDLKGYVTGIYIPFTSTDYREVLQDPEDNTDKQDLVKLLYPSLRYTDTNPFEGALNYDKLPQIILDEGADYLVISNVTSVWNTRGWYDKVYLKMIDSGLCTMEYQNDTWALLKINKDYQAESTEG